MHYFSDIDRLLVVLHTIPDTSSHQILMLYFSLSAHHLSFSPSLHQKVHEVWYFVTGILDVCWRWNDFYMSTNGFKLTPIKSILYTSAYTECWSREQWGGCAQITAYQASHKFEEGVANPVLTPIVPECVMCSATQPTRRALPRLPRQNVGRRRALSIPSAESNLSAER